MKESYGIDIGMGSIKLVGIEDENGSLRLKTLGETKNPVVDWVKGGIKSKSIETVAGAIKMLLSDMRIKPPQIVASLPEDEVISRLIHLPPLKDSEITEALRFEAETFVPYPLAEVSIDYEVVDRDDAGRLSVFAIAAKNEVIQIFVKLFKEIGVPLAALESPAIATRRVVSLNISDEKAVMVVDMGEKYSDLISFARGHVYFTRTMSVGGESLTRAISINLGLDMASAEEYKKAYGMKEMELEGKIKNSILPVFSSMSEEIRRGMVLYREEVGRPVELLVLSGGGANMPGLAEELTRLLGVEVQMIQPLTKIDTTRIVMPINANSEGCRFSLAIGSALRGMV
jgi:type IV pilus assembly protein PilM